jgi:RNA polymerase sigma factor (sigma-70 family)
MGRLNELINREYGLMVRYVQKRIDASAEKEAEDIVQDVLLHLFERGDPAAPIENLAAYIYRSLRNKITDMFRRRVDRVSLSDIVLPSPDDPGVRLERSQELDRLFRAMDELKEEETSLLLAHEFEGRSFQELSEDWDIPVGTLLARKSRAVSKLRKRLTVQNNE